MKNIYLFCGLGADRRVYQPIDFSGFNLVHIEWIKPPANESIAHYVGRLRSQIKTEEPTLIGLSFGGILAIEMAKQLQTERVVIISSVKTHNEVPFVFRLLAPLRLHRLVPASAFTQPNTILHHAFGCKDEQSKKLLNNILRDTDPDFLKWGMEAIMLWKSTTQLRNLVHIHGTADRIFPYKNAHCDIIIKDGSHFMIFDKAKELTAILQKIIKA
jgi:pimeloyl-ACP methyl ester carboxylesterase